MAFTRCLSRQSLAVVVPMALACLAGCASEKKSLGEQPIAPAPSEAEALAKPAENSAKPLGASAKPVEEPATVQAAGADFDVLAAKVIADGFKDGGLQDQLWTALYGLEHWELMTFPDSASVPPGLNIETHDGKKWVMAFTDSDRLFEYAKQRKQLNSDDTMLGLSVPSKTSFEFFEGLQGIEGVRFNEGENGWFAPMRNLRGIHTHLVKEGRL